MEILTFECGPLDTNAYVLGNPESGKAVLIDCPPDTLATLDTNEAMKNYTIERIIITHGHWDHTGGASAVKAAYNAPVSIHEKDAAGLRNPGLLGGHLPSGVTACEPDGFIEAGEVITAAGITLSVLFVPGHTAGHIALYYKKGNALFAGDVLFWGSIGRTDFPGGDYDTLMEAIRTQILPLPDETIVYPGHGPATTVGQEKQSNPFIVDYLSHFT